MLCLDPSAASGHFFSSVPDCRTKGFGALGVRAHLCDRIDNGRDSSVLAYAGHHKFASWLNHHRIKITRQHFNWPPLGHLTKRKLTCKSKE